METTFYKVNNLAKCVHQVALTVIMTMPRHLLNVLNVQLDWLTIIISVLVRSVQKVVILVK